MNKLKGLVRKFAVLALAIVSIFSFSVVPTYAAENPHATSVTESTGNNVVLRRSTKLVNCEQAHISGSGIVTVHLDSTLWGGYLELTASGGSGEVVNVHVKFPNGTYQNLGACASDGSVSTGLHYYFHLPKGDYTFYMDGFDSYYALACIYND